MLSIFRIYIGFKARSNLGSIPCFTPGLPWALVLSQVRFSLIFRSTTKVRAHAWARAENHQFKNKGGTCWAINLLSDDLSLYIVKGASQLTRKVIYSLTSIHLIWGQKFWVILPYAVQLWIVNMLLQKKYIYIEGGNLRSNQFIIHI